MEFCGFLLTEFDVLSFWSTLAHQEHITDCQYLPRKHDQYDLIVFSLSFYSCILGSQTLHLLDVT